MHKKKACPELAERPDTSLHMVGAVLAHRGAQRTENINRTLPHLKVCLKKPSHLIIFEQEESGLNGMAWKGEEGAASEPLLHPSNASLVT